MQVSLMSVIVLSIVATQAAGQTPDVYWSMNNFENGLIKPNIPTTWSYKNNITGQKGLGIVPGIYGSAIEVNGSTLIVGISDTNITCIVQPWNCKEQGFSFAVWMYQYKNNPGFTCCIMRTTPFCGNGHPGTFLNLEGNKMNAVVRMDDGKTYFASTSSTPEAIWIHVALTWSQSAGVKLFINGTEVVYTDGPSSETRASKTPDFKLISLGAASSFFATKLDEAKVWNKAIPPESVERSMFEGAATETTKTTRQKTTKTTSTTTVTLATDNPTTLQITTAATQNSVTTKKPSTTTATLATDNPTTLQSTTAATQNSGSWKWILLAVCLIFLLVIAIMIFLLLRRRQKKKKKSFQPVAMYHVYTDTSGVTSSVVMSEKE